MILLVCRTLVVIIEAAWLAVTVAIETAVTTVTTIATVTTSRTKVIAVMVALAAFSDSMAKGENTAAASGG